MSFGVQWSRSRSQWASSSEIQGFPPRLRLVPIGTCRRLGAAFAVGVCLFVRRDQASACAAFNRHIADGHAAFHGQLANRFATIFNHIAGSASRASFTDDMHRDVFGGHTGVQFACDFDFEVFGLLLDQRLRRQNVFNLGRADAVGQRAECAVCRGVAVTTNDSHAWQGPTLFGANDVHDALAHVGHGIVVDTEFFGVRVESVNLNSAESAVMVSALARSSVVGTLWSGTAMVLSGARTVRPVMRRPSNACGDVTSWTKVAVDIQQASAVIGLVGDVGIPDFVIKRFGGHRSSPILLVM